VVGAVERVVDVVPVLGEAARAGGLVEEAPPVGLSGAQALPGQPGVDAAVRLPVVLEDRAHPDVVLRGRVEDVVELGELLVAVHALAGLEAVPRLVVEHPGAQHGDPVGGHLGHVVVDAGLVHPLCLGVAVAPAVSRCMGERLLAWKTPNRCTGPDRSLGARDRCGR
jgi:hypothetical protein